MDGMPELVRHGDHFLWVEQLVLAHAWLAEVHADIRMPRTQPQRASQRDLRAPEKAGPAIQVQVHVAEPPGGRTRQWGATLAVDNLVHTHRLVPTINEPRQRFGFVHLPEMHAVGAPDKVEKPRQARVRRKVFGQAPRVRFARDEGAAEGLVDVRDAGRSRRPRGNASGARRPASHLRRKGPGGASAEGLHPSEVRGQRRLRVAPALVHQPMRRGGVADRQWPELVVGPCRETQPPCELAARAQQLQGGVVDLVAKSSIIRLEDPRPRLRVLTKGTYLVVGVAADGHLVLRFSPDGGVAQTAGPNRFHPIGEAREVVVTQMKVAAASQALLHSHMKLLAISTLPLKELVRGGFHADVQQGRGGDTPRGAWNHQSLRQALLQALLIPSPGGFEASPTQHRGPHRSQPVHRAAELQQLAETR
mmetsp:Transcript_11728/g.34869  ORF Transcript_11728/g.34869 Transcript_11728/m.34869 type:complete len:420 (+) Transcript_11728:605-1864(+)